MRLTKNIELLRMSLLHIAYSHACGSIRTEHDILQYSTMFYTIVPVGSVYILSFYTVSSYNM